MFSDKGRNKGHRNVSWQTNNLTCFIHRKIKLLPTPQSSVITNLLRIFSEKVSQLNPLAASYRHIWSLHGLGILSKGFLGNCLCSRN